MAKGMGSTLLVHVTIPCLALAFLCSSNSPPDEPYKASFPKLNAHHVSSDNEFHNKMEDIEDDKRLKRAVNVGRQTARGRMSTRSGQDENAPRPWQINAGKSIILPVTVTLRKN